MNGGGWIPSVLAAISILLLLVLLIRRPPAQDDVFRAQLLEANERLERELRREISDSSRGARQELTHSLTSFQEALVRQAGEATRRCPALQLRAIVHVGGGRPDRRCGGALLVALLALVGVGHGIIERPRRAAGVDELHR